MSFLQKNKTILIISGVFFGVGLLSYILFKKLLKDDQEEVSDIDIEDGNTLQKLGELIISKPKTDMKYPLLYVFGGMYYANPDWMLKQVPKYLLSRAFIVFAPYTTSFNSVKSRAEKYIADNNIQINNDKVSIMGFSAGGLNVQNSYDKKYKVVGLIDPSTRENFLYLPFGNNVIMTYNDANWGYPNIKATLPKLSNVVSGVGGVGEKVNIGHSKIPSYFFQKYQSEMI